MTAGMRPSFTSLRERRHQEHQWRNRRPRLVPTLPPPKAAPERERSSALQVHARPASAARGTGVPEVFRSAVGRHALHPGEIGARRKLFTRPAQLHNANRGSAASVSKAPISCSISRSSKALWRSARFMVTRAIGPSIETSRSVCRDRSSPSHPEDTEGVGSMGAFSAAERPRPSTRRESGDR